MKKNRLIVVCVLLLAPMIALADIYSFARRFTMDRLELEVQVTDETGNPLPSAVIWYIDTPIRPANGMKVGITDLQRMARRYASLSDFLTTSDIPGAVFEHTDLQGYYRDYRETKASTSQYTYILVATKRGYLPQVIEGAAPYNRHHAVKFKLKVDPQAQVEPRMEIFDQLMAQARSPIPGENLVSEARMYRLRELEQKTRALAESLEQDGFGNEASAVYWALADFPDVILIDLPNGTQQIAGYRNGRSDAQAEADRLHATQLNTSTPKLVVKKLVVAQGFPRTGILTQAHGAAYLASFEQILAGPLRERVLPVDYRVAIYQAISWSTPDKGCDLLQQAYRFEPVAMPRKDWWARLKDVERQRTKLQLPAMACVIEGLAPMSESSLPR